MNQKISCFSTSIDLNLQDKLKKDLLSQNFSFSQPPYTIFSAKKPGVNCTLYSSGKLTVQGKNKAEFIEFYLEPEILKELQFTYKNSNVDYTPHIGIDESGKGDFFGPLIIGGVYANKTDIEYLIDIGVQDSKKLSDKKALELSEKIKKHTLYKTVTLLPPRYNEIYQKVKNLNTLLGWGHATAIENLIEKSHCKKVIIDQFAAEYVVINALKQKKIEAELTQRHRGESDIVVAAASIIARAEFLTRLEQLGKEFQLILPKGASNQTIAAAQKYANNYGKENLSKVAKVHFSTYNKII